MWEDVYSYDNLISAFHKAAKGKRRRAEVRAFAENLNENIKTLSKQIQTFTVPVGQYHTFIIKDPKERQICAASFVERIYHHALINVYHEAFEFAQIEHSYATRPKKGLHLALYQAIQNNQEGGYWLKLDVKKFFDTINPKVLIKQLSTYFLETEVVRAFSQIIENYTQNTQLSKGLGLPIGNLTSQYFANFYLSFLDRYALNVLGLQRYIRYMDDIVFWVDDLQSLWSSLNALTDYLERQLGQLFKPYTMNKAGFPLPFLGFVITDSTVPNKRNRRKYAKKLDYLPKLSEEEALSQFWILHQFYCFKGSKDHS